MAARTRPGRKQRVEAHGFRVSVTYRAEAVTYPGTIVQHNPAAGALVLQGDTIELVASTPD